MLMDACLGRTVRLLRTAIMLCRGLPESASGAAALGRIRRSDLDAVIGGINDSSGRGR
jgi:hypothetical protein